MDVLTDRPDGTAHAVRPSRGATDAIVMVDEPRDAMSLVGVTTVLLRRRRLLAALMVLGAAVAVAFAVLRPRRYVASASFAPVATDVSRSGLASLAGQFGLNLPAGNQTLSPEFYAGLLVSRTLLAPIARDTFPVAALGGRRVALADLLRVPATPELPAAREDRVVLRLRQAVGATTVKATGVVVLSVSTQWRDVSLQIAQRLVAGLNDYNQRTRQGQAAAERKFVEGRLALAGTELRQAEDRLRFFLERNRAIGDAPELSLERDRIQRDLGVRQQVYTTLTQSYEEAKVREVRDTPVITLVEVPAVPAEPEARGLARFGALGVLLGALVGAVLALSLETSRRARRDGRAEAIEFAAALGEVRGEVLRPLRWMRTRERA